MQIWLYLFWGISMSGVCSDKPEIGLSEITMQGHGGVRLRVVTGLEFDPVEIGGKSIYEVAWFFANLAFQKQGKMADAALQKEIACMFICSDNSVQVAAKNLKMVGSGLMLLSYVRQTFEFNLVNSCLVKKSRSLPEFLVLCQTFAHNAKCINLLLSSTVAIIPVSGDVAESYSMIRACSISPFAFNGIEDLCEKTLFKQVNAEEGLYARDILQSFKDLAKL